MKIDSKTLWYWIIPSGLLAVLGTIFYYPSLRYSFQFDDIANIEKFYGIRHLTFSKLFFTCARWIGRWLNGINYQIGKLNPYYYRVFNLVIHNLNGVMVFLITLLGLSHLKKPSFFKRNAFLISLVTGILFLLHPTQTQTISYAIQGRFEGIAGLMISMLTLCFLARSYVTNKVIQWALTILLFVVAAFTTGSKESAIVAPALIMLVDWFFVAQGDWKSFKSRLWIHAAISFITIFWFVIYLKPKFFADVATLNIKAENNFGNTLTATRTDKIYPFHYMISEFKVILHYLWIFIWPFGISVDYDWKMVTSFFAPDCIGPFIILLGIASFIAYLIRKNNTHPIAFGLLWFFISILPRASIIPSSELLADYKTYVSSFGWIFVIASGIAYMIKKLFPLLIKGELLTQHFVPIQISAMCLLSLPLGYATYTRNKVWSSKELFWKDVLQKAPGRARAYNNYGHALAAGKKFKESIPYFKKAIKMDSLYPDPINNLAVAYSNIGHIDGAIEVLKKSIKIFPRYAEARNNLGSFFLRKKQFENAERTFKGALQVRSYYGKASFNLGRTYRDWSQTVSDEKQKKELMEKAFDAFKYACLKTDFDNILLAWHEYSLAGIELNRQDDTRFALNHILSSPQKGGVNTDAIKSQAAFNLGNIHIFSKEFEDAKRVYEYFIQRQPNNAIGWSNLAESNFKLGNMQAALDQFEKAKSLSSKLQHVELRAAACLVSLGRGAEAKARLNDYLKQNVPSHYKSVAQRALAAMA